MTDLSQNPTQGNSYPGSVGLAGTVSPQSSVKDNSGVRKESTYYMDNYEATVTVHKSPPQQRKQFYDYIEIDDETKEDQERVYPTYRLAKRKNLRVTFSDHIEVDVIEEYESYDEEEDNNSVLDETLYEITSEKNKGGLKQISSSAEFRTVTENIISPRHTNRQAVGDTKGTTKTSVTKTKSQPVHVSQPLLQKRKTNASRLSLTDLEKKTKEYISQLHEKTKRAETQARVARAIFPDISAKIKAQPNYKAFISNAKRAVEITRRYERPWVNGAGQQPSYSMWKERSETVRRTSSLPKNFRLPEGLTSDRHRRPGSDNVLLAGGERQRIRNS